MKKLTLEQIRENIKFIEKQDIIEEVKGGYSEAYTYKIKREDKKYFLKILRNRENAVERIQEILQAYEKSGLDTVNLIECDVLKKQDMYYCIYDWIDGVDLSSLVSKKDQSYFYEIGKKVGEKLKLLKQSKMELKHINKVEDLPTKIQKWFQLLESVPKEIVYRYFKKEEVEVLKHRMVDYIKYFQEKEKCIVHTDIKPGNIMIAKDKIYLIDIEGTEYDYDVFNIICWPVGVFAEGRNGKYHLAFQKGIFEGLALKRQNLDKQILFMYMANFCFAAYGKYTRNQDLNELILYKKAYDKTNQFTKLNEGMFEE